MGRGADDRILDAAPRESESLGEDGEIDISGKRSLFRGGAVATVVPVRCLLVSETRRRNFILRWKAGSRPSKHVCRQDDEPWIPFDVVEEEAGVDVGVAVGRRHGLGAAAEQTLCLFKQKHGFVIAELGEQGIDVFCGLADVFGHELAVLTIRSGRPVS